MKIPISDYARGARVATELVNTSSEVRSTGEALADPRDLAQFLADHDHPVNSVCTSADLIEIHALRDEVRVALAATEDDAVSRATALLTRSATGPGMVRDASGRWQWCATTARDASKADELAALIGTGLLGVLHTLSYDRFRNCAAPGCNGMFVDTSRAGRRRYCTPDVCGNRLNVANHRARRREESAGHNVRPR